MNRRRSMAPALLFLLLVAQSLFAASNAVPYKPFPPAWQATLDLMVAPVPPSTTEGIVPGAVVVVKSPAFGVRVGTTGYADIANKTPFAPDQHFRVGSVTKSFTAQTVLALEQEGKFKLTDPITKYLSDNAAVMKIPGIGAMTIGQALQMNTGIANYTANPTIAMSPQVTPNKSYTPTELMTVLGSDYCPPLNPAFSPPTASYPNPFWITLANQTPQPPNYAWWDYSNSNYILLAMIVEKVTGKPFQDVLQEKVLTPVGLGDTFFAMDESVPANMIHGYTHWNAIYTKEIYPTWHDITNINATYAWAAGAIISTPWDLLKYVDTIFKTNLILNPGTKEKWLTFVSAEAHWPAMQYGGGGLMQGQRVYGDLRGHGGAFPGYKTLMYYFPDSDTTIVLCTNTMDQTIAWEAPEVMILDSIMPLVKSAVTTPSPVNAGRGTLRDDSVKLAWQPGRVYGTSYNVYIGTDENKVERATQDSHDGVTLMSVTSPEAVAGALLPNKTYYWRVDTISEGQPLQIVEITPISPFVAPIPPIVNGPVWSFRTVRGR